MVTTGIHLTSNDNFVISVIECKKDSLILLEYQRQIFKGIKQSGHGHFAGSTDILEVKNDMPAKPSLPPLLQYQSTNKHISASEIFKVLILCLHIQIKHRCWPTICLNFYFSLKSRKPLSGLFQNIWKSVLISVLILLAEPVKFLRRLIGIGIQIVRVIQRVFKRSY